MESMSIQPVLLSDRLEVRPYRISDKESLIELIGDQLVSKWLLNVPYPYTEKDADTSIRIDHKKSCRNRVRILCLDFRTDSVV